MPRLHRAAADKKRLRDLIREAKRRKDRDAVRRHRATLGQIGLLTLGAELRPLLAAIGPIALLATWCALRLEFHPPRDGEPVKLAVYTPVSATDKLIHLVPEEGLTADGWIKRVEAVTDNGPPYGLASWELKAQASEEPYRLVKPEAVYQFADEELESLSAGQKILLRMGSENAARVKSKLSEFRHAL